MTGLRADFAQNLSQPSSRAESVSFKPFIVASTKMAVIILNMPKITTTMPEKQNGMADRIKSWVLPHSLATRYATSINSKMRRCADKNSGPHYSKYSAVCSDILSDIYSDMFAHISSVVFVLTHIRTCKIWRFMRSLLPISIRTLFEFLCGTCPGILPDVFRHFIFDSFRHSIWHIVTSYLTSWPIFFPNV